MSCPALAPTSADSSSSSVAPSTADSAPRRFLLFGIESDEPSDVEVMPFDLQCLIIQYFIVPDTGYPDCALEIRGTNRAEQRRELIALATSSSAVAALFQGIERRYFDAFTEEFGGWILATIPMKLIPTKCVSSRSIDPFEAAPGTSGLAASGAVTVTCARVIEDLSVLHAETLSSIWHAAVPSWAKQDERFTQSGRLVGVSAVVLTAAPNDYNPHHRAPLVIDIAFESAHSFSYENCLTTLHCTDMAGAPHEIVFGDRHSKVAQHELRFSIAEFRISKTTEE